MVIMSVFSFYIMFTKLFEQQKVLNQAKQVRAQFWRANTLEEGAAKLDKNSAFRQLVDRLVIDVAPQPGAGITALETSDGIDVNAILTTEVLEVFTGLRLSSPVFEM